MTQADTFEALVPMIQDAMRGWIEIGLEDGQPIPEPLPEEGFSGKFIVRVPRSLHRRLAEAADRDGVSLNAFVNVALAGSVGAHRDAPARQPVYHSIREPRKTPKPKTETKRCKLKT